jgi:hypothetical protein
MTLSGSIPLQRRRCRLRFAGSRMSISLAAVHHLLKERLASAPSRSQLMRIHKASGGNPFFALEIARLLQEVGAPAAGAPLPVPRDVQVLLEQRVAKLPVPTKDVLLAAAALEEPSVVTLRDALGRSIGDDIEAAERSGVANVDQNLISFAQSPLRRGDRLVCHSSGAAPNPSALGCRRRGVGAARTPPGARRRRPRRGDGPCRGRSRLGRLRSRSASSCGRARSARPCPWRF